MFQLLLSEALTPGKCVGQVSNPNSFVLWHRSLSSPLQIQFSTPPQTPDIACFPIAENSSHTRVIPSPSLLCLRSSSRRFLLADNSGHDLLKSERLLSNLGPSQDLHKEAFSIQAQYRVSAPSGCLALFPSPLYEARSTKALLVPIRQRLTPSFLYFASILTAQHHSTPRYKDQNGSRRICIPEVRFS